MILLLFFFSAFHLFLNWHVIHWIWSFEWVIDFFFVIIVAVVYNSFATAMNYVRWLCLTNWTLTQIERTLNRNNNVCGTKQENNITNKCESRESTILILFSHKCSVTISWHWLNITKQIGNFRANLFRATPKMKRNAGRRFGLVHWLHMKARKKFVLLSVNIINLKWQRVSEWQRQLYFFHFTV